MRHEQPTPPTERPYTMDDLINNELDERISLWHALIDESEVDDAMKQALKEGVARLKDFRASGKPFLHHLYDVLNGLMYITYRKGAAAEELFAELRDDIWHVWRYRLQPSAGI